MTLYTFIMDYRGGTYVAQVRARSVQAAARRWASTLEPADVALFGPAAKRQLIVQIAADTPTPLAGLVGAWCLSPLVRNHLALINVVETVG